jgi:tetratricopeptide (TPR) repeat protein
LSERGVKWAIGLTLFVATVAVYSRSLGSDFTFVNVDDNHYVTANPDVQRGLSLDGLAYAFTSTEAWNWHPVTWLSLELDSSLFGISANSYRRTNIIIHAAAAVMLFCLLQRMTGDIWPSALVAALFALHPVQVESVAWITERKGVLAALFWLLTMAAYAWYAERPGLGRYLLIFVPFVLGLMSKAVLVTLPPALLLLDYWPLRRWPRNAMPTRYVPASPARLVIEKLPLFALVLAASRETARLGKPIMGTLEQFPVSERLAVIPINYVAFIRSLLWPTDLAVYYPHPHNTLPWWQPVGAAVFVVFLTAIVVVLRRWRYLPVGWFWFLGTLVPVIGIVQLASHARTDHYVYLPSIGVFMMISWALADLFPRGSFAKIAVALALAALVGCAVLTWNQLGYWRDSEALWRHDLEVSGDSYVAHERFAMALAEKGDLAGAEQHLRIALSLPGAKPEAWGNYGVVLEKLGRIDDAAEAFERMIKLDPRTVEGYLKLARVRLLQGRLDDAVPHFEAAARLQPESTDVRLELVSALTEQGDFSRAHTQLEALLARDPDSAALQVELARLFWRQRKLPEMLAAAERALARDQLHAEAWNYKGLALEGLGRSAEAIAALKRAVRLDAKEPFYHVNLAHALYDAGERGEAAQQFAAASRLLPEWPQAMLAEAWRQATHPDGQRRSGAHAQRKAIIVCQATNYGVAEALDVLAAAETELGHFDDAVTHAKAALKLLRSDASSDAAKAIRERLALYEMHKPFRDP